MTSRSSPSAFVGRGEELGSFDRAAADARNGLPSVLLVSGDAGIGKSSLITEGARRAEMPLHLGRCAHVGGELIPLAPIADLLRQIRRSRPDVHSDVDVFDSSLRDRAAMAEPGQPEASGSDDLFVAVLELIGRLAATSPVVVGIEDLHWADDATWDLFEFLARNVVDERVVLVGTHRANEATTTPRQRRRLAELGRLPGGHRLRLTGLEQGDVAAQVTDLLGGPAAPALVATVLARGQGNPFFTEELVAAHLAGEPIPIVLADLISADVAELDRETRQVLGAIAAVGRETTHELLVRIADLDAEAVERAVRAALDAHLLVVDDGAYRFRHALIGEVIYADLLPPQRARVHRRVADALQEQTGDVLGRADRASELAFHLDRAGDVGAAFVALLAAADAAASVAPGAAFPPLQRALILWDAAGDRADGEHRSDRMWQAAELADATVGSEHAVELAQAALEVGPPPQGAAWGHERLGRYLWSCGRLHESQTEFERAAEMLTGDDDPEAARVFAGLAQAEFMAGHFDAADQLSGRAIELASDSDIDRLAWVVARHVQGSVRNHLGDPETGVQLCGEAFRAAPTAHSRGMAAFLYAVVLLSAGRNEEAISVALDAAAEGHRAGLERSLGGLTDTVAAEGLIRLGRWNEAEAVLAPHLAYDTVPLGALRAARAAALLAARRGDGDRARAFLADAGSYPVDGMHQTFLDMGTADVRLILGEWAEAATAAERGWLANPTGVLLWSARFAMLSIEAAVEQALDALAARQPIDVAGIVAHQRERLDAVRRQADSRVEHVPGPDTAAHLAHAAASLSRLEAPDPDAWAEAVRRWTDLGDTWWTTVARLREAEAAANLGMASRAATALRDAHRLAADLGAAPLLTQIVAMSQRTRISVEEPTRVALDETSISHLGLTPREVEVLTLVSSGQTNRQIGAELFVSEKTAGVHVSNILRKLGVSSRVDAAAVAQRLGAS